jgi:hypothetical protein
MENEQGIENVDELKNQQFQEPAYQAPEDQQEQPSTEPPAVEGDEPDVYDEEAGVDDELADLADFDAPEQNPKETNA